MISKEDVISGYRLILGLLIKVYEALISVSTNFSGKYSLSKHKSLCNENYLLSNGISDIKLLYAGGDKSFFVVLDSTSTDPVSNAIRTGVCPIETRLTKIFNQPGSFLDIGANIGAFSLYMASYGWSGYAFEASSKNAQLLKKSININNYNVMVFEKAVFDHSGKILFRPNGPFGLVFSEDSVMVSEDGVMVSDSSEYEEIDCIALDDAISHGDFTIDRVDLIKLDIEGSEYAALQGMKNFLNNHNYPPIFMEINAWTLFLQNITPLTLLRYVKSLGYHVFKLERENLYKYNDDYFPVEIIIDVLLLKNIPTKMSLGVFDGVSKDENEMVGWIIQKLGTRNEWAYHEIPILFALKDFPKYYNNPQIRELLSGIQVKENDPDAHLTKRALSWFWKL
jgi:FkbM family methyltransferase